eukprot:6086991-Prymnesium_polylepis.1
MQKLKLRPETRNDDKFRHDEKNRKVIRVDENYLEARQAELGDGQVTKHRPYYTIRRNDVSP